MKKQISFTRRSLGEGGPKTVSLVFGVLIICFLVVFYVLAWTEPSSAPPSGSVPAPINVGGDPQTKAGSLTVATEDGTSLRIGSSAFQLAKDGLSLAFKNNGGTTRMIIGDDGNVGIRTPGPSQALDLIGSLELEDTTTSTTGVIYKGADRFIHNFHHPTGGTAKPVGQNTFVGINAGNLTMGSTATQTYQASRNVGIGGSVLLSNTTGYNNTAIGNYSLYSNTTGNHNTAMGISALRNSTGGYSNSAMGGEVLYSNTTGYSNSAMGMGVLRYNTSGYNNSAVGRDALYYNTTGYDNSVIGQAALQFNQIGARNTVVGSYAGFGQLNNSFSNNSLFGYYAGYALTTGSNNILLGYKSGEALTTGSNNIVIGYDIDLPAVDSANMLNIGNLIFATGLDGTETTLSTGNVGIGTTSPAYKLDVNGDVKGTQLCIGSECQDKWRVVGWEKISASSAGSWVSVSCSSSEKRVMGGGCTPLLVIGSGCEIYRSYPISDISWYCGFSSTCVGGVTAYIICADYE